MAARMERPPQVSNWRDARRGQERARRLRARRRQAVGLAIAALAVTAGVFAYASRGSEHSNGSRAAARTYSHHRQAVHQHAAAVIPTTAASRIATAPILMYHVIADPPAHAPFPGLYIPPAEFAAQIHALAAAGFHSVTLDGLRRAWEGRGGLPRRPIVITFDNGYRTQFTRALPVLRSIKWVAVENLQLSGLPPSQGGLTRHQVRALVAAGWELDTQGWSHADLPTLDPAALRHQVADARSELRRVYHVRVDWFCYPSGRYDQTVVDAVRAAGFVGSTTVSRGWARATDDPFRLPRIRVLGGTSPGQLLTLINGSRTQPAAPNSY